MIYFLHDDMIWYLLWSCFPFALSSINHMQDECLQQEALPFMRWQMFAICLYMRALIYERIWKHRLQREKDWK